jgi:flagellar M-ring protein FliF
MDDKESAHVVDSLQKAHIPYQLQGSGNVMVPANQLYAARIKLAGEGITPTNGVGFELFDKADTFGLSEFAQKVNYQRALQGELARTIEVIPQVSTARVQLVMPKDSAFADRERKASASVMLQLVGDRQLPAQAVQAIQNLVAAGVPDLTPKQVTVVDSAGNLLSSDKDGDTLGSGRTLQDYQTHLERRMETRLTSMLEQVVGVGQAVVRVTAQLNREEMDQQKQSYNPDEQVVRSQRVDTESRTNGADAAPPVGVPGIASNTPGANPATSGKGKNKAAASGPSDQATHTERVTNYEISSTREHVIVPSGGIKRLSVAVIVGGHMNTANGKQQFVPRDKQQLASIQSLVQRAIGYDEDRGDTVDVQSMPLVDIHNPADAQALTNSENRAFYLQVARYGLAALALVLIALFILRPLAKRLTTTARASAPALREFSDGMAAVTAALPEHATAGHLEYQSPAKQLAAANPDHTAMILQQWMRES